MDQVTNRLSTIISTNEQKLNVANWNANSIRHKLHEFYDFLVVNEIDTACIQETMLSSSDNIPSHPDYYFYRADRLVNANNRASGGVAIIIKRSIQHQLLPSLNLKLLEAIGVEISLSSGSKIQIWSIYLPGGSSNTSIQQYYHNDLLALIRRPCSYFINGDLNSKHRLWNCSRANTAGNILYNLCNQHNFLIVHPSTPTHFPFNENCLPSTIDLLLTNALHDTTDIETHTSNSNLEILTYSIKLCDHYKSNDRHKIPLFSKADWNKFQMTVNHQLAAYELPSLNEITTPTQIDTMVNDFTNALLKGQEKSVPLVSPTPYAINITPDIKSKIQLRNALKRRLQRNPDLSPLLRHHINHLSKEIKSDINLIANANFQHKLSSIESNDNNRSLWQTSKFLKNRNKSIPPLKQDGRTLLTPKEKCNALADQFVYNHTNPLEDYNMTHTRFVNRTVNNFLTNCRQEIVQPDLTNDAEVLQCIRRLRASKAPGIDKVHNSLLKKLPPIAFVHLAFIFNCCLTLSYFPKAWKHAKVISIKKPGKPPFIP